MKSAQVTESVQKESPLRALYEQFGELSLAQEGDYSLQSTPFGVL